MLPTGLVPAHHAVHVGDLVPGKCVVPWGGTVGSSRCPAGLLAAYLELRPRICRNVLWPLVYYHCHAIPKHFGLCLNHRRRDWVIGIRPDVLGEKKRGRAKKSASSRGQSERIYFKSFICNTEFFPVNIYQSSQQQRGINMIDACERSLQLRVFLAAQQSINTLFFRVWPLGKVSPISQRAGCKDKMLSHFFLAPLEFERRRNSRQPCFAPVPRSLQSVRRTALGFTQDQFCLLNDTLESTLAAFHVILWRIYLVPSSSWKQYQAQSRGVPCSSCSCAPHWGFGERSLIFIYPTHSLKYPRWPSVWEKLQQETLCPHNNLCRSSVSLHPTTVCPISESQSYNLGESVSSRLPRTACPLAALHIRS